jgi:hypothetical protein
MPYQGYALHYNRSNQGVKAENDNCWFLFFALMGDSGQAADNKNVKKMTQ